MVLSQRGGREVVTPDTLRVTPGQYASFRSGDHWPRRIRLLVDSVGPELRAFLEREGSPESPPLVHPGARWVVEMSGAPPGAYPFVVEGPRNPGRGVLLVETPAAR